LENGNLVFYTMGADRATAWTDHVVNSVTGSAFNVWRWMAGRRSVEERRPGTIFQAADELWQSLQHHVADFVNTNGGQAEVVPRFSRRFDWQSIKQNYFHPTVPLIMDEGERVEPTNWGGSAALRGTHSLSKPIFGVPAGFGLTNNANTAQAALAAARKKAATFSENFQQTIKNFDETRLRARQREKTRSSFVPQLPHNRGGVPTSKGQAANSIHHRSDVRTQSNPPGLLDGLRHKSTNSTMRDIPHIHIHANTGSSPVHRPPSAASYSFINHDLRADGSVVPGPFNGISIIRNVN
jgi:hypothetical protein